MKKFLSLLLAVVMIVTIVPVSAIMASAQVYTGTCGDTTETGNTVSWSWDLETGVLNFIGRGRMKEDYFVHSNGLRSKIDFGSFNAYPKLNKVIIGSQVTTIGPYGLYFSFIYSTANEWRRLVGINEVVIGSGVKEIGYLAFSNLPYLKTISIPSACQIIDSYAFQGCTALEQIDFGGGLKTLGSGAFYGCTTLNTPNMPASLTSIGKECFLNCSSMTGDMTLYSKLASIGEDAFRGTNLDSITIYNSDCEIFENATTIPMKTKIIGHIGSTAQEYADEFGNEFEAIEGETTEVVEPTCTEQGYTIHTCNDCGGKFIDTYTSALGHQEISAPAQAATCTEPGHEKGFICSVCGAVLGGCEEIPAKGHTPTVTKEAVAPTCTETGLTEEITCSDCKEVLQEQTEIPALGHKYDEETITEPTCTETGVKKLTCSVCHESHTEDIQALNHNYVNHVVAPTCTERGYTRAICERCDYEFDFDFTDATGVHDYQAVVTTPATCTQKGARTYTCSHCGDSYTEDIECIAHSVVTDNAVAATCTTTGLTAGTHCSRCGTIINEQEEVSATGHNYNSIVTSPTCKNMGYTTFTCSKCGDSYRADYTETTTDHNYKSTVTLAPTCSKTGIRTFTCSICGDKYNQVISKVEHTPVVDNAVSATCVATGLTAGSHCSACGKIITAQEEVPATGHNYNNVVVTAPSCRDQGYTTHTCSKCGDSYRTDYTQTTSNHSYKSAVTRAATCSLTGIKTFTCSICGDKYTEAIPMIEHIAVTDNAVAPTCTKTGLTVGSHCSVCGCVISKQEVVNATGHTYSSKVTAPSCRDQGYTEYTCSKCGDSYRTNYTQTTTDHDYKATVTTAATCSKKGVKTYTCSVCDDKYTEEIPMIAHTIVTDSAVAPTCTKSGLTQGSHCSVCGLVITEQKVINANNHSYTSSITKEASCSQAGVKTYTCSICGDKYNEAIATLAHTVVTDDAVAPTCTKSGLTQGTHCSVCGKVLTAQTQVNAKGHSYNSVITTDSTCTHAGIKTFTCSECGASYKQSIALKEHTVATDEAVAPTCTKSGLTQGSHCSVCGTVLTAQTQLNAKGHSYTSVVTTDSTCTQAGVKTFTCSACGDTYKQSIALKEHTAVTDSAVEPTCTKSGLTQGTHCSACGKALTAQTQLNAKGHSYTSVITTDSTCTQTGVKTFTCSACGDSYTQSIALKEHTIATDEAVAPTCTRYGLSEGKYCSVCGKVLETQEKIEPLGHAFGTKVTPATLTSNGLIEHPCSRCEKVAAGKVIVKPKTFKLAKTSFVYTGKAIKPALTVKDANGKILKNGTDYSVVYRDNKAVGIAKAVITFKGNYSGTKTLSFVILPKGTSLAKVTIAKKSFTVQWKKSNAVTGYQIQYSTNSKFKGAKTVTFQTAVKLTIKSLQGGKKYYIRVRTYKTVGDKNYYSTWSGAKAVTTKK